MPSDQQPGAPGMEKTDLILYRLEVIERQTIGLVRSDVYEVQRAATLQRIAELEEQHDKQRENSHKVWLAVAVALIAPFVTRAGDIIGLFTTGGN